MTARGNDEFYIVRFAVDRACEPVHQQDELEGMLRITGSIRAVSLGDDQAVGTEIGQVEAFKIPESLCEVDPHWIADDTSGDFQEAMMALLTLDGEYRPAALRKLGDQPSHLGFLYVSKITVIASHRGKRLGLYAMEQTIRMFGDACGVALYVASPLQDLPEAGQAYDKAMGWDKFPKRRGAASQRKLARYWAQLGALRELNGLDVGLG